MRVFFIITVASLAVAMVRAEDRPPRMRAEDRPPRMRAADRPPRVAEDRPPRMRDDELLAAQKPEGFHWNGQCVADTRARLLRVELEASDENSPSSCMSRCASLGYSYAGVEYGDECFCGNTPPLASTIVESEECDEPCTGDASAICGGSWNMNVYKTGPCQHTDRLSSGCSPLPGPKGMFRSSGWEECSVACHSNKDCGAWEYVQVIGGLCFNFQTDIDSCIVGAESGVGYTSGYRGCQGTPSNDRRWWWPFGSKDKEDHPKEVVEELFVTKHYDPLTAQPPRKEVEEPEFVTKHYVPLG